MRPALVCDDVHNLDIDSMIASAPASDEPVIRLEQSQRTFILGCRAPSGAKTFLSVTGPTCDQITIMGNDLSASTTPLSTDDNVPVTAVHQSGNRLPGSRT